MGRHTTTTMALNMFMNDAFPVFGRRLATPRFFGPRFDFERAFAETEQRRSDFLSKMEVDPASNGAAQCYSYSSSTFRSGDNAPVTQSSEEYRVAGGTTVSRTRRSVGSSCITSISKLARFKISAQVLITRPWLSTIDWLKLKPFKLNAIVEIPKAVNQIPITGQAAKKKCKERELLKLAYWKIKRPK